MNTIAVNLTKDWTGWRSVAICDFRADLRRHAEWVGWTEPVGFRVTYLSCDGQPWNRHGRHRAHTMFRLWFRPSRAAEPYMRHYWPNAR